MLSSHQLRLQVLGCYTGMKWWFWLIVTCRYERKLNVLGTCLDSLDLREMQSKICHVSISVACKAVPSLACSYRYVLCKGNKWELSPPDGTVKCFIAL